MKYLKTFLYILVPLLLFNILLSVLYYFNIIGDKTLNILNLITASISMLIGGIYIGKKVEKKGYLEGLKIGLITIFILFTISFLAFDKGINIKTFIYYFILLISSVLGSMIGINKKKS